MKKFICTVCGYVHEGDEAPEICPQCKQPKSKFKELVETEGAQLVQSLKCNLPGISLTAAIPFEGQAERYNIYDKRVYRRLLELADKVIVLSDCYYPRCFLDRDEFMVENASYLIAYYDGRGKGGTYYTVKKARARSIPIINVY